MKPRAKKNRGEIAELGADFPDCHHDRAAPHRPAGLM
jgi:hypothetical protein